MSTIQKWGNSLAVRILMILASRLGVRAGTSVELVARAGAIVVRPKGRAKYRLKELLKKCRPKHLRGESGLAPTWGARCMNDGAFSLSAGPWTGGLGKRR